MDKNKIRIENLTVKADNTEILKNISLSIRQNEILSAIGPAGSGKTTFLRCLNRLIDTEEELSVQGSIKMDDKDIFSPQTDLSFIRRKISMVFAVPTPLPMSIRDNLRLGLRFQKRLSGININERIEKSLRAAFLWDEVKNRLHESAMKLSGGQQQRLCLARSLMVKPEVLLLDEPCSGLDPISTAEIEEALKNLKKEMTIILVTNNVKQASRTSDRTVFFLMGDLIEMGETGRIFTTPKDKRTSDYVSGRFG